MFMSFWHVHFFHDMARVSHGHAVGWNVVRHYGTGPYDGAVADSNTGTYRHIATYPATLAYPDRATHLILISQVSIGGVLGGIDMYTRCNECLSANIYPTAIQNDAPEIDVNALLSIDLIAIVTIKRRLHIDIIGRIGQKLADSLEHCRSLVVGHVDSLQ